ncbi:tRNA lysidine(34) synthetase TilS [Acinetobacter baumannii]
MHLYGRVGQWPLKKVIQEAHILPWLRHTIQILVLDNVMLRAVTIERDFGWPSSIL